MILIGKKHKLGLFQFRDVLSKKRIVEVCPHVSEDLQKTRDFIDFLLKNNIEVYGVTTGLACPSG